MPPEELTTSQVAELLQQLLTKQQELASSLEKSAENAQPVTLDQQSVGRVSRIDAIQQQQMAKASREQDLILQKQVAAALKRIEIEEYGYCIECAESIGFARLQAQPQSPLCLNCQSKLEQR